MPIVLDPDQRLTIVLKSDQKKPAKEQPKFHFTFLSSRKERELDTLRDEAMKAGQENQPVVEDQKLNAALLMGLKSWEKMPGTPSDDSLMDVLTTTERWELLNEWRLTLMRGLDDAEKKASDSPSESPGASTARPADEPATDGTVPASPPAPALTS